MSPREPDSTWAGAVLVGLASGTGGLVSKAGALSVETCGRKGRIQHGSEGQGVV